MLELTSMDIINGGNRTIYCTSPLPKKRRLQNFVLYIIRYNLLFKHKLGRQIGESDTRKRTVVFMLIRVAYIFP